MSIAIQRDGYQVSARVPMPVMRVTCSLSWWVELPPPVRLPVAPNTPVPSDAMQPAAQMPSPCPPVAQPPFIAGLAALMPSNQPWDRQQSPAWPPYATYTTPPTSDSALRWFCGCGMNVRLPDSGAVAAAAGHAGLFLPGRLSTRGTL